MEDLGTFIAKRLEAIGISIREASRRAGLDHSYLSRVVRGEVGISRETAEKLSGVLGVSADELLILSVVGDKAKEKRPPSPAISGFNFRTMDSIAWTAFAKLLHELKANGKKLETFRENCAAFLVLGGMSVGAAVSFSEYILRVPADEAIQSMNSRDARLIFHALLFTLDPVSYARTGNLHLDQGFNFTNPDEWLRLPSWFYSWLNERVLHHEGGGSAYEQNQA